MALQSQSFQTEPLYPITTCAPNPGRNPAIGPVYPSTDEPRALVSATLPTPPLVTPPQQVSASSAPDFMLGFLYNDAHTNKTYCVCPVEQCGLRFKQPVTMKRHYNTKHGGLRIWCPFTGCERSEAVRKRPFPAVRSYNLKTLVKMVHGVDCHVSAKQRETHNY